MDIEILAPCGSMESLVAAVRCGAGAVYLGTKDFNARKGAKNFDENELKEAIKYAHERGVKVYITVNTLVSDDELETAYNTVKSALLCGADAFIVQDLGLAKVLKESFEGIRLHASTQCSVNTPDGFNALKEIGFSRAVLPREMSLEEIKEIRKSTDIELEMFVHGALCMCVSGQCYLSSMLGSRSGNRGLCAQPCRLEFSAVKTSSHDLSLKDLSLISHIKEIEDAGVISLKIEGRMKRPEYVACAVSTCKKAIEGNYSLSDEETLKSVFSRSGFTDGYFTGLRQDMFGYRQKEDVIKAKDVLKDLAHLYDNENPLIAVDAEFYCKKDEEISLILKTDKKSVSVFAPPPEIAVNKPLSKESVKARLSKFGSTQYFLRNITVTLDDGVITPASIINGLRRSAVLKLNEEEKPLVNAKVFSGVMPRKREGEKYFTARFLSAGQIPENHNFRRIFLPIWESEENFIKTGAGVEIPRGLFGSQKRLIKDLERLKKAGVKNALCSNFGAYETAKKLGFSVFGDWGLNIFNSKSAEFINSPILSFELTLNQANAVNKKDTGIVAYGKLPLMLTRNCPVKNSVGCEKCKKDGALTDRKGYKFPVKCSPYPCVEILNSLPLYLGDRMSEIKTDFIHFYFTDETKNEVEKIVNLYKRESEFYSKYTRGLYYRGVK